MKLMRFTRSVGGFLKLVELQTRTSLDADASAAALQRAEVAWTAGPSQEALDRHSWRDFTARKGSFTNINIEM
jgi:hypothetical protein